MSKRLFDILFALAAMFAVSPILALGCVLVFVQDRHWPLYAGTRVGRFGRDFRMIKLRTMLPGADRLGGTSTATSDPRLTRLGSALRRLKIDELPQFWNVLTGELSVVGPRPNIRRGGVERYTPEEEKLLRVRPGITDLASIVFSDEGEILKGSDDPDALYDAVIRPWKNRLALLYIEKASLVSDVRVVGLTVLALISKPAALSKIGRMLEDWNANSELRQICARMAPLPAGEPPGRLA